MKKTKKRIRRYAAIFLLPVLLMSASCFAPKAEEIEPIFDDLVEASYEINEIFFGKGLETYPRIIPVTSKTMKYSEEYGVYYLPFSDGEKEMTTYYDKEKKAYVFLEIREAAKDEKPVFTDAEGKKYFPSDYEEPEVEYMYRETDDPEYDVVRIDAKYHTIAEIKKAAEKVYTKDYLEQIYQRAFDGIVAPRPLPGGGNVRGAKFVEYDGILRQLNTSESMIRGKRIYDFSTMKIVRPSGAKRVNVTMDTHIEGETETIKVRLTVIKCEDGKWYLDSPTY